MIAVFRFGFTAFCAFSRLVFLWRGLHFLNRLGSWSGRGSYNRLECWRGNRLLCRCSGHRLRGGLN
jgi:hypothetical protein